MIRIPGSLPQLVEVGSAVAMRRTGQEVGAPFDFGVCAGLNGMICCGRVYWLGCYIVTLGFALKGERCGPLDFTCACLTTRCMRRVHSSV